MLTCAGKSQPRHGIRARANKLTSKTILQDVFSTYLLLSALWFVCAPQVLAPGGLSFTCPQGAGGSSCLCSETEVDCAGLGLTEVPRGLGTNVERIILRNNAISSIDIITSQNLPHLMYIDASYNTISSVDWSSFSSLTNLEELHLQMNSLFFVDISYFQGQSFHTLNISGNQLFYVNGLQGNLLSITHLDLSNNMLTTLPSDIFDGIDSLESLNIAGNPWLCDCDLLSLKVFVNGMVTSGGIFLNAESTFCVGVDNALFNSLTAFDFSDCEKDLFLARTKRQTGSVGSTTCQVHSTGVQCGSDEVGSCVYNFASQSYSIVHYTSMITNSSRGNLDQNTCRDECHSEGAAYFLFENSTILVCLCGDVISAPGCTECDATMAAGLAASAQMCSGQYTHLNGAASVLHDFQISVSSPSSSSSSLITAYEEVTFEFSGGPSDLDQCAWDFGDASTSTVLNRTPVSHIFIYVGSFDVRLTLSASTSSSSTTSASSSTQLDVQVTIQVTVSAPTEQGDLSCPVSPVRSLEAMTMSAEFISAWGQPVSWTREDPSSGGGEGGEAFPEMSEPNRDGSCEAGWAVFHDRCIRVSTTPLAMSSAHFDCASAGGRLLRFHSQEEITELGADATLFTAGAGTAYYTGALWNSGSNAYMWKFSFDKAFAFRETLEDSDLGDCVQLSSSGPSGVDCNQQLPYICEKDPVTCTGTQSSGGEICYTVISSATTWDQAQADCSSTYSNGRLASSIGDSADNYLLANMLSGNSWIGLRASSLQGHYVWQDGGLLSLTGFSQWASDTGAEPCVSMDMKGQWYREACDSIRPYVCQYFIGDEIKVQWNVAGTLTSDGAAEAPQDVSQITPGSVSPSTVTILPGSFFHSNGQLLKWVVGINRQASDVELALQIWRPVCSTGTLDRPGCNSNSPFFTCTASVSQSCTTSLCSEGEYFCLLSQSCVTLAQPCTCAGALSVILSIDCTSHSLSTDFPTYQLISSWVVQIPAGTTRFQFELPRDAAAQFGDVLGFQAAQTELVACETSSSSAWRNTVMSKNTMSDWLNVGDEEDPATYTFSQDVYCEVTALFSDSMHVSSPGQSLSYITSPGDYTLSVKQGSTSLGSCSVTIVDDIKGFLWIYPEPSQSTMSQGSILTAVVNVQGDLMLDLVVKVLRGTDPIISWTFNGGSSEISRSLSTDCPATISQLPESCSYSSSFLSAPYASIRHSFSPSVSPLSLTIHASNDISFTEMRITFHVYSSITDVEFYHQDCQTRSNCEVYVEEGVLQEFFVSAVGQIEDIIYYQNGQEISPAATAFANHSMTFSNDEDMVLSVNVSNPVSWMEANLTLHARIRAIFGPVSFDTILDKVALGVPVSISARATVTFGASILVTWTIGDVNSTFEQTNSMTTVTPTLSSYVFQTSGNASVTVLLENYFGDSVSASMVVEVYKTVESVVVGASSTYIATGEQFELTIRVDNCTSPDQYHYGQMSFVVDWGTGSGTVTSFADSSPLQSLTHAIDTAGVFTVTVTVVLDNDSSNSRSGTLVLNLQEKISGLRLTYDGPKHVFEQITFTATLNSGTDVLYSLDFGDGASAAFQSSESFVYQYSAADVYKAVLTAQNDVSQRSSSLTLYAYDETLLQIIRVRAPHCSPVNTTVSVSTEVAAQLPDSLNYTWNFGNGDIQKGIGLDSASTMYVSIGNFFISLEVENSTGTISDVYNTEICVEESIAGLTVQYTTPVALVMPGATEYATFVALVQSGSNMTYEWTVNDDIDVGNYDTLNWTVTQAGTYNVTVIVRNDLDSMQKDMQLVAMEVIAGLSIECLNCSRAYYCKSQTDIYFQVLKQYGTHENYTWTISNNASTYKGNFISQNFLSAGNYTVDVIAMNEVSTVLESVTVFAQEEIMGFTLVVNQTTAIVNRSVAYQASYTSGTSLRFLWECNNSTVASSSSDILVLSFPLEGYYNCSAAISNEVSTDEKSVQITVVGLIDSISINHNLIPSQVNSREWYASANQVYGFQAVISTDFLVTYEWEIIQSGSLLKMYNTSGFNHSFAVTESFNIGLKAVNDMSSDETLMTVHVQEPVAGVQINTSSQVFMILGVSIAFKVSHTSGSDVTYEWRSNSTVQQSDTDSLVITFTSTGIFVVEVTVANELGFEADQVEVNVFEPVGNVSIQLSQTNTLPFVSLTSDLEMSAPNASGSDLVFQWVITDSTGVSVLSSDLISLTHRFVSAGSYTIQLDVSNLVSSLSDSVNIEVQGTIVNVSVGLSSSVVATSSLVTFSADTSPGATDISYTWQIDGAVAGNVQSFAQQFQVAGAYLVTLVVENNISSAEAEATVRVLDPVTDLQITDCDVRLAQSPTTFSSHIDSGTNVTFFWSIISDITSETFLGQSLNYTFPNQGIFNVSVTASNDLGSSSQTCLTEAHLPIGNVSLDITSPDRDYIFLNLPVTFSARGENFQHATFTWSITGQPDHVSSSSVYTVSFTNTGQHNLTLDISNGISQENLSLSFTVRNFRCFLPQVGRVGAEKRSVLRSQALELEVTVDPQDCTEYIAVHTWSVYQATDCSTNLNTSLKIDLENTTTSSPALMIKARALAVGSYCMEFSTGYHYTSVSERTYFTLNVTSSPLHAVIKGGTRRTVAIGSELCLDGSSSYDPDDLVTSDALDYSWHCTETNATGGCFSSHTEARFCHSGFTEGTYQLTLQISASGRVTDSEEQIIEVLNVPHFVPIAGVVCVSCLSLGNYRVSCSQHVALSATCDNCGQCLPNFWWKIFEGQQEISLDSSQTSTGVTSSNLVLPKWSAIKDDRDYTFVAYVSCTNSSVGTASLTLPANRPPSGGSCQFSPLQIVPLEDQVTISCPNWFDMDDPNTAILYTIYVDSLDPVTGANQTYPLYTGTDATQRVYLGPYGADSVNLRVIVSDEFGASVLGGRSTITFLSPALNGSQSQTDYLSQQTDSVLSSLTRQASPVSLLQYSIALGQQLNAESRLQAMSQIVGLGSQEEQRRAAIRDAVTICLTTTVPVSTLADVQQMAYALKLLTDYSAEYLTEDSQVLMMQTLSSMLDLLQLTTNTGLDRGDVPTQDILSVLQNVLSAANARVYSVADIWTSGRTVSLSDFSTDFQALRPEISQAVGDMSFEAISLDEAHRRRVVSTAMPLLEDVLIYTLATMMVGETGIELDLGGATVNAYRSYANEIERQSLSNSSQVQIADSLLDCCKSDSDEVLQVMMSHERNPYTYGDSTSGQASTTMPVQTVSFYEPNGSIISISELPENSSVQLYMFSSSLDSVGSVSIEPGRLVKSSLYRPLVGISYKTVTIEGGKSKVWTVPDTSTYAEEGVGVHIQLRVQFLPNDTDPSSTVTSYVGINYSPDASNYAQKLVLGPATMADAVDHRSYTFFLRNVKSTDTVYVTASNDDTGRSVLLSVGSYFSSCEYFDVGTALWSRAGCTVQDESTATVTSCVCNHLTSFGGAGVVSITDIDFADLDNLDLNTNPVVFIALSIVLVLYIVTVLICRYLDTLDLRRISRIPLCGRDGPFKYEIAIVTGRQFGSGTTAHIGLKLYGTQNKGEARHVTKPGAFQRGARDVFHIAHLENLGELSKILVWHDNTGLSPSWFLSHLTVRDLQTGARYTFVVNSWLSLEIEDGVVQKTVKVAGEEELLRYNTRFTAVLGHSLADTHAWLSVSERPDHSRFTRVQRATVLLTCIYLYMCINAVWYGAFKSREELERDSWHGSYGWEEVIVALVTTVIVVPFLLGLSFVFKRSRCKESIFQEVLRPTSAQTLEIEAMCDIYSRDEGSFRTVTPLGDWVPAIDRESTTESIGVPVGLKRTVPMHRFARRGSTDSNMNKMRPPVLGKKELWSRDNIMQSWPDRMPTWIKQVKAQVKGHQGGPGPSSAASQNSGAGAGAADTSMVSRRSSRSTRTFFSGSRSVEDSDDDLQQRLDEMDAEIARDEERNRRRKISQELRQKQDSMMDLFDSDDEWVNEGLEELQASATGRPAPFNPRKDAELVPAGDRRNSKSGSTLHSSSSVRGAPATTSGSASSRRDSSSVLWRDGARPGIVSASIKSKSSLSDNHGFRRSLSTTTSQGLPLPLQHLGPVTSSSNPSGCCPFLLPHWCTYLAYAVCIKLCLLAAILVLLYGYRFGSSAALKWVVSLCCSILVSILVIEPLRVLFLTIVTSFYLKNVRDDNADIIDIKPTVESNEQIKDVKFRPLGGFALLQAKLEGRKKLQLQTMLREVTVFTFMFALLLAMVFINFSGTGAGGAGGAFTAFDNIHSKLHASVDGTVGSNGGLNFTTLKNISDFWIWSESVLAPTIHHRELQETESFGYLMGTAQMRQFRTANVSCPADSSLSSQSVPELVTRRCVDTDVTSNPITDPYGPRWIPGQNFANWTFSSAGQLNMPSKFGQRVLYPGSGYVQHLDQTYNSTLDALADLQRQDWLNLNTRAVLIEFCLYSPSHDLTSCVTLLAEFAASGGVLTSSTIQTEKLLKFTAGVIDPLMVCQVMFSMFLVYLLAVLVSRLFSQRVCEFIGQVWNWVDLAILMTAWAQSALYIACVVTATQEIDAFLEDRSLPAPLGIAILLHGILRWVQGLLVFLLCFKIVRQIRFCRPLYKFYMTLSTASGPIVGVLLIFTILLLTYAQFGYLLYSSTVASYRSVEASLGSLLGVLGGRTDFWPLFESQRVFTHLFFLSYAAVAYGLALCLSVAVLSWSMRRSREQMSFKTTLDSRDYEMVDYMIKRFKLIAGIDKPKPAFRHVKFAGLPSLPSRATSSNVSSRQSCREQEETRSNHSSHPSLSRRSSLASDTVVPAASEAGCSHHATAGGSGYDPEMEEAEQSMDYLMASLLPTWDQVLQTLQKVEDIDKSEDDVTKQIQEAVKKGKHPTKWATQRRTKPAFPDTKPIMGKPPLDPKATFARFKSQGGSRGITVLAGRSAMTPPSTFASDNALGHYPTGNWRPFSDQGIRRDPKHIFHLSPSQDSSKENNDHDDNYDIVADVEEIMSKCRPSYGRPPSSVFSHFRSMQQQQQQERRKSSLVEPAGSSLSQSSPSTSRANRRRHSTPASASSAGSSSTALRRGSPGSSFYNESISKSANTTFSSRSSAGSSRSDIGQSSSFNDNTVDSYSSSNNNSSSNSKSNSYSYSKNTFESSAISSNTSSVSKTKDDSFPILKVSEKSVTDEGISKTEKKNATGYRTVPDVVPERERKVQTRKFSGSFTAR